MKSLTLKDGVELLAIQTEPENLFITNGTLWRGKPNNALMVKQFDTESNYELLGTSSEFLSRPDAEDRCEFLCEQISFKLSGIGYNFKNYNKNELVSYKPTAVNSFRSALESIGAGEKSILIIKLNKKNEMD